MTDRKQAKLPSWLIPMLQFMAMEIWLWVSYIVVVGIIGWFDENLADNLLLTLPFTAVLAFLGLALFFSFGYLVFFALSVAYGPVMALRILATIAPRTAMEIELHMITQSKLGL